MSASIRDVAQLAGVSIATVSKVMNQRDSAIAISPQTKERVLAAVRELRFVPDPTARALRSRRSIQPLAAVVVLSDHLPAAFVGAAERALAEQGYGVQLLLAPGDADLQRIGQSAASPVIALGDGGELLLQATAGRMLVLVAGQAPAGLSAVELDLREGLRVAVQHLSAQGHRRIGLLLPPGAAALTCEGAYRHALPRYGLAFDAELLYRAAVDTPEAGRGGTRHLLSMHEPPTALIALSERLSAGALQGARETGRAVPGNLSLVGWSRADDAELAVLPITSIHADLGEAARLAVAEALTRLADPGRPPRQHLLPMRLVTRHSTGPVTVGR